MNSDKLKGFSVLSLTEGIRFGHVVAPLFDPATLALRAFQIEGDGQSFLVPLDQVGTIGTDALMVENSRMTRAATAAGAFGSFVAFDALRHLKVVNAAGTFLGTLRDLESDPATGAPLRLTIHKGGFLHLGGETLTIEGLAISGVAHDLITIANVVTTPVIAPDTATAPPTTNVTAPNTVTVRIQLKERLT